MSGYASDGPYNQCPCGGAGTKTRPAPSFVGLDYYCESGTSNSGVRAGVLYNSDPLWDGKNCGSSEIDCCKRTLIPWFYKLLSSSTADSVEMRICCDEGTSDEDVAIKNYEIYVK